MTSKVVKEIGLLLNKYTRHRRTIRLTAVLEKLSFLLFFNIFFYF